jgi:dihydrofolate synthase / folylpolyglutamate synthase
VPIPGEHASLTPAQSAAHARAAGIAAAEADDVEAAVAAILKAEREPCRILICGSLYLAGTVLAENG